MSSVDRRECDADLIKELRLGTDNPLYPELPLVFVECKGLFWRMQHQSPDIMRELTFDNWDPIMFKKREVTDSLVKICSMVLGRGTDASFIELRRISEYRRLA